MSGEPPVDCTLHEMLERMKHFKDDDVFRWFQDSAIGPDGCAYFTTTYRLTFGELRKMLAEHKGVEP